jgi:ActR/RegA family two-component response regulator
MKLPLFLIGEDSLALASLRQQLDKEVAYFVEPRVYAYRDATEYLRAKGGPVVAVIDLNRDPERAFTIAEEIKFKLPNVHLVMTAPDSNPQTILRAMRSGAGEFLTQPFNWPEVLRAFDSIRKKIDSHSTRTVERGKIIAISSNKGGVGSTTLATNIAAGLVGRRRSVCLVDLVLQFGSVTSFLNIDASYTILDLVKNIKRIDPLFLDGSLVKHASGVRVLAEHLDRTKPSPGFPRICGVFGWYQRYRDRARNTHRDRDRRIRRGFGRRDSAPGWFGYGHPSGRRLGVL